MRKLFALGLFMFAVTIAKSQLNPVSWTFTARKIADKTYEIHAKATIQKGWHLYSQNQPDDAIAVPTSITFNGNPVLTLEGKIKEVGNLEKFRDEKLDISANQYSQTVDFVQVVKLKLKAKTNITGSVEYQTCDDKKCLPPKTVQFSAAIQ
jgi:thiol:disulfide interchange protein DsbD